MLNYINFVQIAYLFIAIFGLFIPLLISVAFLTLVERKILGAIQRRVGPDQVGFVGLLQPIADAAKLIFKETVIPNSSNQFLYFLAPILSFSLSLAIWAPIPIGYVGGLVNIDLGILYIFGLSSLSVYSIVLAGWSSGSRYAFLGALRSAAQMISYEVSFGLILISVLMCVGSLSLAEIVEFQNSYIWFGIPLFPLSIVFFISTLAETSRPPFDLPEAEAELVAGYNVEYSSIGFALFFIAEYANIIMMSTLNVVVFWGGWSSPVWLIPSSLIFIFKVVFFVILFIWVRAVLPRYRYDQLMFLGWKVFLPISLGYVVFVSVVLIILYNFIYIYIYKII
jgi:NADH-quinone oxidoreductase subunit H